MAEREIYNPETGQYEFYDPDYDYRQPDAPPPSPPQVWQGTPADIPNLAASELHGFGGAAGGGRSPAEIEAEGRAFDAQHGYIGGYMMNGQWVNGSPHGGGGGGGGGGFDGGGYNDFAWPRFNAPRYSPGPQFQAPPAFSYAEFKAPDASAIHNDPSFKLRRDEGMQAIEHGAAAKGLSRLPSTLKALAGWNQDFAGREYGNIFDRSAQTWGMNRNNAADAYSTNYGISRDVWDRNETQNLNAFDRNYRGAFDEFDYNQFRPSTMTFNDMYNRWKASLDASS